MTDMPQAWADLIHGLTMLARHQNNDISPFNCSHDELTVMADPTKFTAIELDHLAGLGFLPGSDGTFTSYRFGSA